MRALVDDHVIAASQPMEIAASRERGIRYLSGGVMMAPGRYRRHAPLHGLELRAVTVPGVARQVAARVSALAGALSRRRPHRRAALRRPRTRGGGVGRSSATTSTSSCGRTSRCGGRPAGSRPRRGRRTRPRSRSSAGCARRAGSATTSIRRPRSGAAARRLPRSLQARLLPAVRRDDGADAPLPRHPGPRRRRVHERDVEGRHLDGDRSRCARLGRGLVRRARLAHLRSDARDAARCRRRTRTPPTRPTRSGRSAPDGSSTRARSHRRRRGAAWRPPRSTPSAGVPWRLIVPLALVAAAAPRSRPAEERSALASRPHRRPAAPRSRGAGRAGRLHPRPGLAGAAVGLGPPALARAPRPWSRHRRLRRSVRAGALRAAGERRGRPQTRRAGSCAGSSRCCATRLGPGRRIRGFLTVRSLRSG